MDFETIDDVENGHKAYSEVYIELEYIEMLLRDGLLFTNCVRYSCKLLRIFIAFSYLFVWIFLWSWYFLEYIFEKIALFQTNILSSPAPSDDIYDGKYCFS